jgi:Fe-S-cluster containining protein
MSLCDKCFAPGACCKGLSLSTAGAPRTLWLGEREYLIEQLRDAGLPFEPSEQLGQWTDDESGKDYASFSYNCPNLLPSGRCGDYENRPQVCSSYEPRQDSLCVHFHGEAGDPTIEMGLI